MTDELKPDGSGPGPHYVVDMVSQFVASVWHLMDNSETSGPIDDPIITVWAPDFNEVSAWLDRLEGLPSGSTERLSAAELVSSHLSAELTRLRAENAELIAANQALMVRDAEAHVLFNLAHSALIECEAILGGEYGDHYGPLAETMTDLHMRIENGAWLQGGAK